MWGSFCKQIHFLLGRWCVKLHTCLYVVQRQPQRSCSQWLRIFPTAKPIAEAQIWHFCTLVTSGTQPSRHVQTVPKVLCKTQQLPVSMGESRGRREISCWFFGGSIPGFSVVSVWRVAPSPAERSPSRSFWVIYPIKTADLWPQTQACVKGGT